MFLVELVNYHTLFIITNLFAISYLFSTFTDTSRKPIKISFADGGLLWYAIRYHTIYAVPHKSVLNNYEISINIYIDSVRMQEASDTICASESTCLHIKPVTNMEHERKQKWRDFMDNKFITIGEIMLRLTPPNYEKIRMTHAFEASYGGAEANIA